ncbi:MAG: mechanosensitive ion channel domain-containing protein [Melioribacteraceae bacterium]
MKKKLLIIVFFTVAVSQILAQQYLAQTADSIAPQPIEKSETKSIIENILPTNSVEKEIDSSPNSYKELTPGEQLKKVFSPTKIFWAIFFFIIGYYLIKLLTTLLYKISEKSASYRLTLKGLIPVTRIISWTLLILFIIIGIFNPPMQSIILVTGSFGIAVGFAAQDVLKNIFGGIMILFDRPFQVGDKILIGSHYGEVLSIGLRSTRLVTADDSLVTVPNAELMSQPISNANTGETNCQVVAEIYLPAYIDTEKARRIAIDSAQVSKFVFLNKPISVIFKNEIFQNRSVLKMRLKAYVLDIRYEFPFMSEMTEITLRELIKEGVVTKEELNGLIKI